MLQLTTIQRWITRASLSLLVASTACAIAGAQDVGGYYSNRMALSGFVEYSNDSSHMFIGYADGRKISALGIGIEKRTFVNNKMSGSLLAEFRPLMKVSDPTLNGFALQFPQEPAYSGTVNFSSPIPVVSPVSSAPLNVILIAGNEVYTGTATYIGGMRSTYVTGVSPIGYKLSTLPNKRIQPFVTVLGGFVTSPRDIPVLNSASFNFTFELGAGVEIYRTHTRSCRLEYRYHHLSNGGTGNVNPGIDSGVMKVTYSFGR